MSYHQQYTDAALNSYLIQNSGRVSGGSHGGYCVNLSPPREQYSPYNLGVMYVPMQQQYTPQPPQTLVITSVSAMHPTFIVQQNPPYY